MSEQNRPATQLPLWRSHKEVWGDKITRIEFPDCGPNDEQPVKDWSGQIWHLACHGFVYVTKQLAGRVPDNVSGPVEGYYVRYKDGFESWSPATAFEDGYTRVS